MTSPLDGTRCADMLQSLDIGLGDNPTPAEILERIEGAQRLVFAAMGAEYLRLCGKTGLRSPSEALGHWLTFCSLANPSLMGSDAKMEKFRPILRAVLKDVMDISSGKIQ